HSLAGQYWKNTPTPADLHMQGWPVFFDHEGDQVTALGGSGGFAIHATHTVKQTVRNSGGKWATTIAATAGDNDAVTALFGAVDGATQIAARVDVGHATAAREDITPLEPRTVTLLTPHEQA